MTITPITFPILATKTSTTQSATMLGGNYADTWDDFVGQKQAVRQLKIAAKSAKMRGVSLPHTLIATGEPGVGKTTLALLLAKEMGTNITIVSGKMKAGEARMKFASMNDGDILFIDEIHQLVQGGKANAEWLLHYLQDGVLVGPCGAEQQPKVTIVGATTDGGRLPATVLDRFPLKPELLAYTEDEASMIARSMCKKIFPAGMHFPDLDNLHGIARAASHNPRQMGSVLAQLRDLAMVEEGHYNEDTHSYDITETLMMQGLTEDGLTPLCRKYLISMFRDFPEGAGAAAMKDSLGEPGGLEHTESLLMKKRLIVKTRSGRMLTQPGIQRARSLAA